MKVLVLGIDGLEARLIEKWHIREYMQKYYGVHDVTIAVKPGEPIYTPLIWASFLLGEPAYKYGFTARRILIERDKRAYGILAPLYALRVKLLGERRLGIRPILKKIGLYRRGRVKKVLHEVEALPKEALKHTIVEEARRRGFKVWVKEFPGLGDIKYAEVRATFYKYLDSPLEERVRRLNEIYEYSISTLREAVNSTQDNDLVLYYTALIDEANHMLYRPGNLKTMTLLATYYKKLAKEIRLKTRNLQNTTVLIVSDHGYDPSVHEHSNYGFWSSNRSLPFNPKSILDFKEIILGILSHNK